MEKQRTTLALLALALPIMAIIGSGCKPKTATQKIEDAAEDTSHEVEQGVERAKENVDGK